MPSCNRFRSLKYFLSENTFALNTFHLYLLVQTPSICPKPATSAGSKDHKSIFRLAAQCYLYITALLSVSLDIGCKPCTEFLRLYKPGIHTATYCLLNLPHQHLQAAYYSSSTLTPLPLLYSLCWNILSFNDCAVDGRNLGLKFLKISSRPRLNLFFGLSCFNIS